MGIVQVFLQAESALVNLPGDILAHVTVVPGLVGFAGNLGFAPGVSQNETVLPGILVEPDLDRGILLVGFQELVGGVHNVHRQAGLMLAGAGEGHKKGGFRLGFLLGKTLGKVLLILRGKQILLVGGGVEYGGYLLVAIFYSLRCEVGVAVASLALSSKGF